MTRDDAKSQLRPFVRSARHFAKRSAFVLSQFRAEEDFAAAWPRSPALFQRTRHTMGPKIEEIEDELPPLEDVDEASTAESGDAKVRATRSSADRTTSAEQDLAPRSR